MFVDSSRLDLDGPSGAVWSLPRGGDLDANVVVLRPDDAVGEHVNDEVDVVLVVVSGDGRIAVDAEMRHVRAGHLVHAPRGSVRSIRATGNGPLVYVTVHRARRGLGIGRPL